jgi:cytosine/adenosine deaminase-related metal-dependent hydrolase
VLPVDQQPIEDGVVTIRDGQIVSVGSRAAHGPSASQWPVHDLGDMVLLPGLVNAHTHLEFSHRKQPLGRPCMRLPDWIRLVLGDRKRALRDPAQAIRAGLEESLQQGVTTVGEIATLSVESYGQDTLVPSLVLFDEVIGFSEARVDSVLGATSTRLTSNQEQLPAGGSLGLSPHAPYTVHPKLLDRLVDLAIEHQLPMAMHLAESPEELQLLARGDGPFQQLLDERSMWDSTAIPRGTRVLDYLMRLARAPRGLVVHGNYLETHDFDFLAQPGRRITVVYCPRTHAYFGHRPYPLTEMLAAGVRVALGTDSRASSPDLSLLSEMREVARKHSGIRAERIVRLGTLAGAQALGLEDYTGSITPGKWANLTALPCDSRRGNPYEAVVEGEAAPVATWVRGELAFQ